MDFIKKIFLPVFFILSFSTAKSAASELVSTTKDSIRINEVTVIGFKHTPALSVTAVDRKMIEKRLQPSVMPLLTEEVPGVFITQRGVMGYGVAASAAGGINIRGVGGSPTSGVLVLIDGHPQYMGLMGHPLADSYQSSLIERVEVTRGAASMLYGSNAFGGVINIITKKQEKDGTNAFLQAMYGGFNTFSSEISAGVKKGKWSSNMSAGYNRTGGHRENMDFSQIYGNAKVEHNISKNLKTFVDINISKILSSNPGRTDMLLIDNDADILRGSVSLAVENEYEKTAGAVMLYANFGKHNINDGYKAGGAPLDYRFHSEDQLFGVVLQQAYRFFSGNNTVFGMDFSRTGGKAWNQFPDKQIKLVDIYLTDIAGYVHSQQTLWNEKFKFSAGIRYDYNQKSGRHWIPQFGISYQPMKKTLIKGIVSKGFRNPTIREMYMFPPQNPDLKPERLMNYELSFAQNLVENKWNAGLNLFHIRGENMIQAVTDNGKPKNINTSKIKNSGLEISSAYKVNKGLRFSANYSYLRMEYKILAAPEHKLYVGGSYSLSKWNIGTGLQYINGLYTRVEQNPQKQNFLLWDVRLHYKVTKNASLFAKGENLLNREYEMIEGYPMPGVNVFGGFNIHI